MVRMVYAVLAAIFWAGAATAQSTNIIPYNRPSANEAAMLGQDAARLLANAPRKLDGETDLACMAVAVYHEARGENIEGQRAVASVILQRSLIPDRWGSRPCEVVKPIQFSFMHGAGSYAPIREGKPWETALRVSLTILLQGPDASIMGADHYHTPQVFPVWRHAMDMVKQIGNHKFYVDPISIRKTAEHGIQTQPSTVMAFLPTSPQTSNSFVQAGSYDWSGAGTPTRSLDGVRGLNPSQVQDLYAAVAKQPKPTPTKKSGGFSPVRGPDVDAIARAATPRMGISGPQGSPLGMKQPIDVAAQAFKPVGLGLASR